MHNSLKPTDKLIIISLFILPFLPFASLLILLVFSLHNLLEKLIKPSINDQFLAFLVFSVNLSIVLSSISAFHRQQSLLVSFNFCPFFLLFFAFVKKLSASQSKSYLNAILLSSVSVVILAITELIFVTYGSFKLSNFISSVSTSIYPRSASIFDNPNTLSSYLVIILGIMLGLVISSSSESQDEQEIKRVNNYINCLKIYAYFVIFAIACTQSRNGLITTIILIIIAIAITKKNKFFWVSLLLITLFLPLFAKTLTLSRVLNEEINIQSNNIMLSVSNLFGVDSRTAIWSHAIYLFQKRPILGWGLGNYQLLYPVQDHGNPLHAHSLWLMLLTETGLLGFISLNMFVGYILFKGFLALKSASSKHKMLLTSCLMSFLSSILFQLFDCTFFDSRINVLNWLHLAIIYTLSSSLKD